MACPYRKDVASGVWAAVEYDKLIPFDAPTGQQPPQPFACHAAPGSLCHGWAVCHSNRGRDKELLALRLLGIQAADVPAPGVPVFKSGIAAAKHGKKLIDAPNLKAIRTIVKLQQKHKRLR